MTTLFFSYSHADSDLRDQLEKHLAMLKRQGRIDAWHDRKIVVGDSLDDRISEHLKAAGIILLLVSSDFLSSEYCYGIEMNTALRRHHAGEARVIPIILRPCDWKSAPFAGLLATPTDARPVTKWADRDEAWLDVVEAIKKALPKTSDAAREEQQPRQSGSFERASLERVSGPRSSNLRLRKEFSDADRSKYLRAAFEYMTRFFSNSLEEIQARNPGVETEFTLIDAQRFSAVIYRGGKTVSQCQIRLNPTSAGFGSGISFSYNISDAGNSFNESLSVEADDQAMFLRPLGMNRLTGRRDARLSEEGAAELYWEMLIERLQT